MNKMVICKYRGKGYESILTVNKVYEVKRENDEYSVVIVGDDNIRYVMPRAYFIEVKVLKKVRYTKESYAYIPNMIIGNVYEVVEEDEEEFYIVIDSKMMTTRVPKQCFEEEKMVNKVICIYAGGNSYITEGREYEVVKCREQEYGVVSNIGEVYYYPKSLFKPIGNKKRIMCVDKGTKKFLTLHKIYEVENEINHLYYIYNDANEVVAYSKNYFKGIEPTQSPSRNISINIDTTELQDKLEKALYHLKEFNKVMGEIGEGKCKVKVNR